MKLIGLAAIFAAIMGTGELKVKSDAVKVNFEMPSEKVKGTIGGFRAKINFDKDNLAASSIEGTVDVKTLDTGSKMRDKHLKTDDFFSAETYPTISFKSSEIAAGGDTYRMKGMMQIEDQSHEEWISFTFSDKVFKASTQIDLTHYDVGKFSKGKSEKSQVMIDIIVPVE